MDASLRLLAPLGIAAADVRFDLPSLAQAETFVDEFVHDACLSGGFAVVNGAASWKSKQWPADRFGRVARYLGEQYELPTVVTWAGGREAAIAQQIICQIGRSRHCRRPPPVSRNWPRSCVARAW